MTAVKLGIWEPGSAEWHENRRAHLGGSEVAAVVGLHPYQSAYSLWHLKAGLIEPQPNNQYTEWGHRLEPVVADKFAQVHGLTDGQLVRDASTYAHPHRPWQSASPDGLIGQHGDRMPPALLEIKTAQRADRWGPHGSDEIPVNYRCQLLWTMDVLNLEMAYLAVLIGGADYREYLIVMDQPAIDDLRMLRAAGQQFMDSLAANTPPDIDDSWATLNTVRELHPDIEPDSEVEFDRDLAETYMAAKHDLDDADRAYRRARSDIGRHMGRAQYAACDGVRFARRQPARDNGFPVLVSTRKELHPRQDNAA